MTNRTYKIPARTVHEAIISLEERPADRIINVQIQAVDKAGQAISGAAPRLVQIDGDSYTALIADDGGELLPGKPAGTYRNEDLWHFIDALGALD